MPFKRLAFLSTAIGLLTLAACGGAAAPSSSAPAASSAAPKASSAPASSAASKPAASASGAGQSVTIGVELPMSGGEAANGVPTTNGVQLAVDQANAKGGKYTFKVVVLDDAVNGKHDPAQGAKNIQQFVADKSVMGVVGPFNSNVAQAEIPLTNEAGLVQISPANTNPDLTKPPKALELRKAHPDQIAYFRVCTTDDFQGPAGADYTFKQLNKKAVFIVDDNETYGKGLADAFEGQFKKDGGKVLGHEHLSSGQQDFKPLLTKIKATNPDVVYFGGVTTTGGGLLRKQMKDVGMVALPYVGGDGIQEDEFLKEAGDAANGTYATVAAPYAEKLPAAQDFLKAFKAKYTKPDDLGAYSASGYDAASIIIQAVNQVGPDRAKVRQAVAGLKDFKGALGTYGFDQNGDTTSKVISVYGVAGGKWEFKDQFEFK